MNSDRINLGRRKQDGTPKCQINLRNRKASLTLAGLVAVNLAAGGALNLIAAVGSAVGAVGFGYVAYRLHKHSKEKSK